MSYPDAALDLGALFLSEASRRVQRDRTVSLNGIVYDTDAALVGEKVTLRFDLQAPPGRSIEVWHQGQRLAEATPLDAYANCFVRRARPSRNLEPDTPALQSKPGLALRALRQHHEREDG